MAGKNAGALLFVAGVLLGLRLSAAWSAEPTRPQKLTADFTLKRTLKALTDTLTSTGRLVIGGPGLLLWETLSPGKSSLVVNRTKAWIHYPDLGFTRDFELGDDPVMRVLCEHLSALTVSDFGIIGKLYEVADQDGGVKRLIPKDEKLKSVFSQLRVKIDEKGIASWVEITSMNGDTTLIEFENIRINPELSSDIFEEPLGRAAR